MRLAFFLIIVAALISCSHAKRAKTDDLMLPQTVSVPEDGNTPVAGVKTSEKATKTHTFNSYGEKIFVKTGDNINFIYEGIDPEKSYLMYESTDEGYILMLMKRSDPVDIKFVRLCQTFIVASPALTSIDFDDKLRYEQIIWTPREDGSWEVRVGATQRGCRSEALDRLNKLRTKDYEKNVRSDMIKQR